MSTMPPVSATTHSAGAAPHQFAERKARRLAYRTIGVGTPIVLCTRFRGNLDTWDPAFLDGLAGRGFQVITFDYSGLGLSTGTPSYDLTALAGDALDLIDALGFERVVLGGWSLGGLAAQVFIAQHPGRVSHAVLAALKTTRVPILHIGGDHDISFPVENWYALNRQLPTLQLVTFPQTGHGPQHQHPEAAAATIEAFVRSTGAH